MPICRPWYDTTPIWSYLRHIFAFRNTRHRHSQRFLDLSIMNAAIFLHDRLGFSWCHLVTNVDCISDWCVTPTQTSPAGNQLDDAHKPCVTFSSHEPLGH